MSNRKILFRAKRADNGEWVRGYPVEQNSPDYHAYIIASIRAEIDNKHIDIMECNICEVIPETICLYTEFTDKNGQKIFEEDIVSTGNTDEYLGVVKWDDDNAGLTVSFDGMTENFRELFFIEKVELEIIGNIYDNPELLEASNEQS